MLFITLNTCVSFLFFSIQSQWQHFATTHNTQTSNTFFTFAYAYGDNNVLLITEIQQATIYTNTSITPEVQLYSFLKENDINFKRFIRSHYSRQAANLFSQKNSLVYNKEKETIQSEWHRKIGANKGNVIYVKEFKFDLPVHGQSEHKKHTPEIK